MCNLWNRLLDLNLHGSDMPQLIYWGNPYFFNENPYFFNENPYQSVLFKHTYIYIQTKHLPIIELAMCVCMYVSHVLDRKLLERLMLPSQKSQVMFASAFS